MSDNTTIMFQLPQFPRHSRPSSPSSESDVDPTPFDTWASRRSSACWSDRSCEGLTADRMRDLWTCMLELQDRYGCYHCTRLDLALEAGDDAVNYMPNRFIIDTLNDSVIDLLPQEGWEMLNEYLRHD